MPYETREQAIAISVSLGCPIGAHKTDDGKWNPCRSESAYLSSKKASKDKIKVPLTISKSLEGCNVEIPTGGFTLEELCDIKEQNIIPSSHSEVHEWVGDVLSELNVEKSEELNTAFNFCKVNKKLGLVLGWAIVCKKEGKEYFDLQGDHITEEAMLEGATDFMLNSRVAKDMHRSDGTLPGSIVFAFPMTEDIAKAFGVDPSITGLMVAMKPDDKDILNKFESGEYTGFSIGGSRVMDQIEYV